MTRHPFRALSGLAVLWHLATRHDNARGLVEWWPEADGPADPNGLAEAEHNVAHGLVADPHFPHSGH
jgi:hypothetical protein